MTSDQASNFYDASGVTVNALNGFSLQLTLSAAIVFGVIVIMGLLKQSQQGDFSQFSHVILSLSALFIMFGFVVFIVRGGA